LPLLSLASCASSTAELKYFLVSIACLCFILFLPFLAQFLQQSSLTP
jgi:hypothetical protein